MQGKEDSEGELSSQSGRLAGLSLGVSAVSQRQLDSGRPFLPPFLPSLLPSSSLFPDKNFLYTLTHLTQSWP